VAFGNVMEETEAKVSPEDGKKEKKIYLYDFIAIIRQTSHQRLHLPQRGLPPRAGESGDLR